jgi:hypothetical protein
LALRTAVRTASRAAHRACVARAMRVDGIFACFRRPT